ncbi:hypothetical protein NDR96_15095 [Stenotrophomonas maltophilia]|nr:hypothetical protein NDR96_15095 [Stenotrophomonas maltophilia]
MRRSRLLLPALGLALLTACQGRSPEPGKEPPAGDAPSAEKAAADGKMRWSEAVVWDGDLNACRQGENAATGIAFATRCAPVAPVPMPSLRPSSCPPAASWPM